MPPLRVLRVIHDLQVGGVQRMMLRSLRALAELNVQSEVLCVKKRGVLADEFERAGFPVHLIPFTSRLAPLGLWKLRQLVRQRGFNLVHAHMYASNIAVDYALLGLRRVRIINGYHSTIPTRTFRQSSGLRLASWIPDAFVAVSGSVKQTLVQIGLPEKKIEVIHNGIVVPAAPLEWDARETDAPLQLLWAGRFVTQKRLPFLLEVVEQCRRHAVPIELTLVGEGPTRQATLRLVEEKGLAPWVRLPGLSHDVPAWLRQADLYVSASEREGFANALLEAAAAGRGMMLSDIPPHHELLAESGGGIIPGDDPLKWCEALAQIARDRSQIAALGRAAFDAVQQYSLQHSNQKLLHLYQRLVYEN